MRKPSMLMEALIAIAVSALGLALLIGAMRFDDLRMAVIAGPGVFPMLIGGALILVALAMAVELMRNRTIIPDRVEDEVAATAVGWRGVFSILGSILVFMLLIRHAGLVIAGTLLFVGVAYGFQSKRLIRDGAVGFAIALATYIVFNAVLGLRLPGGPFELLVGR